MFLRCPVHGLRSICVHPFFIVFFIDHTVGRMCQMDHDLCWVVHADGMYFQRMVVDQLQAHLIPGGITLEIVHCLHDLNGIVGKVTCPQVRKLRIQDHLPGIIHIIGIQGISIFPHAAFPDLDLPYLSFLIHLDRLLRCQLSRNFTCSVIRTGEISV